MALGKRAQKRRAERANEQSLKRARGCVLAAKKHRLNEGYDDTWKRVKDLYKHKHYEKMSKKDRITVNYVFSTINVILPSITIANPKFTVSATKGEDADRASIAEAVTNYWWKHYGVQKPLVRAAKDFLIFGHGWLKVCWLYDEEDQPRDPQAIAEEAQQLLSQRDQAAVGSPDLAESLPSDQDVVKGVPTTETVVLQDRPHVERVSVHDMFADPYATCEDDMRWIAQRMYRTKEEVIGDDRYDSTVRSKVKADSVAQWDTDEDEYDPTRADGTTEYDARRGFVTVWEFYDLARDEVCSWADGVEGFLIAPSPIPYPFGHPYVMIRNYDVPDEFYPIGEIEGIEGLQHELNKTRTQMIQHRDRGSRKWLANKDKIDSSARAAIESNEDNIVIPIEGGEDFDNVIKALVPPPVAPDFYNQSQIIVDDMSMVTGISEYQRGGMPDIRRTATEASIMQDAINSRSADKLKTIEQASAEVGRRLLMLAQEYMTGEQAARVVGAEGSTLWFNFDAEYIKGDFDFEVEAGSTQPNNESMRRQSALQMADALGPFIPTGVVNVQEVVRFIVEQGFGQKNAARFINQLPPPLPPGVPPGAEGELPPPDPSMAPAGAPPPEGAL